MTVPPIDMGKGKGASRDHAHTAGVKLEVSGPATPPSGEPVYGPVLKVGQFVKVWMPHWPDWEFARVVKHGSRHCQLHGEFIEHTVTLRKVKRSGRESYLYDAPRFGTSFWTADESEVAPKEAEASPTGQSADRSPSPRDEKNLIAKGAGE